MFNFKPNLFNQEIGIDIGTVNTVIYAKSKGIVVSEPSVVAVRNVGRKGQKDIIAYGMAAKKMIGRTPQGINTMRPISHGVIADFDMTQMMIKHYMERTSPNGKMFSHPRVAVCAQASVTEVEKRAVVEVTLSAGAREAFVVEEPLAAAVGIGLPISEARGSMIVNMGGGTCEVSVLAIGGIVTTQPARFAGNAIDDAIVSLLRQNYMLAIGESTAEEIKIAIGSAMPLEQEMSMEVKGRDLVDGLPKVVTITSEEVREFISPVIQEIEDTIRSTIEKTPPELVRDIVDHGIMLSGGTSNLRGLSERFAKILNVPVHVAEQPVYSVALGLGKILDMPRSKNGTIVFGDYILEPTES